MITSSKLWLPSCVCALALGCGAETGNGLGGTLRMELATSASGLAPSGATGADAAGAPISVDAARINVRRIELDAPGAKRCADADFANAGVEVHCDAAKIRVETDVIFDLLTGVASPSVDKVQVPAGPYSRVSASFADAAAANGVPANDPLIGRTIMASGTVSHNGTDTPFDLALSFTDIARFEAPGGITVTSTGAQDVLMLLDVKTWFSGVPISQCLEAGALEVVGGRAQIHDKPGGACSDIERILKAAIRDSGRLARKAK